MILHIDTKKKLITCNDSKSLEEFKKEIELLKSTIGSYGFLRLKRNK